MFNNKKNISIIAIVLIAIIGLVYAGCSKSTDMQTTPEMSSQKPSLALSNEAKEDTCIHFDYLINDFRELNPNLFSLPKTYFLNLLFSSIVKGKLGFEKERYIIPFQNKIKVVKEMIDEENINGAINKMENDLLDKVEKWIVLEHKYSVGLILEATIFYLKSGASDAMLNIDYFSDLDKLNGYAWVQVYGGKSTAVFQLEGNKNNYYDSSIFYPLASLKNPVMPMSYPGRWGLKGGLWYCYADCICECWISFQLSPLPSLPKDLDFMQ
jgi:hypothetical protein